MSELEKSHHTYHVYIRDDRDVSGFGNEGVESIYFSISRDNLYGFLYQDEDVVEFVEELAQKYFDDYYNECEEIFWTRDIYMFTFHVNRVNFEHEDYNPDDPVTEIYIINDKDLDGNLDYYKESYRYKKFVDIILKKRGVNSI